MRILHVLDHSLPLQSGYVYRTLSIVNQQRRLGWQPVLVTSGKHYAPGPDRERIGNWEFLRTPQPKGLFAAASGIRDLKIIADLRVRLREIIFEVKPDIVHAHSPVLNALAALGVCHQLRIPLVYEVRAFWEDAKISTSSHIRPGLRYLASKQLETYALKRVDAVVTICEGLARDICSRGISSEKVTIVPNAVDRNEFCGPGIPDQELGSRLGLLGNTVLGFFGSFYFYEGLHILLQALPELKRHRPDIAVLLVGGGPEEARLRDLAGQLALGDSIKFVGRVAHQEIQRYYDLANLLVFPRLSMRLTELVTPLKPLEAMAQERIVVASDVGGHRELIRDGGTGYLFMPNSPAGVTEGVLKALADQSAWPRIRAAAIKFVDSERSWSKCAARYAEVYNQVIANWGSRRGN